jgi:hypothetical protein
MQKNDLASVHDRTRGVDSILTATTLRTMPPIRRLYKLAPSLRRFSRLGNIESVSDPRRSGFLSAITDC